MTGATANFSGSIPHIYDTRLGPYIFEGYAADIAKRAAAGSPRQVLEIAAGTGIVTRQLRAALPSSAQLTATDLNDPMLDLAREKLRDATNVSFRQADACALPFEDGSFDCAVCQFGVMFFPDKPKAFSEVARVLRPQGRYIFNVWCALDDNPFAKIAHETIASFFASDPPAFYKTPFGYHDAAAIEDALRTAGFARVRAQTMKLHTDVAVVRQFAQGLVFGNPVSNEISARSNADPETVADAIAAALHKAFGDDPIRMPLQALVFEAAR